MYWNNISDIPRSGRYSFANHWNKGITMKTHILLSVSLLVFNSSVRADPEIDCRKATSTPEENYCAEKRYEKADKQLNQVYGKLKAELNESQKKELTLVQTQWIKFRDAACDFETQSTVDGTGYGGFLSNCLERITRDRIKDIEAALGYY